MVSKVESKVKNNKAISIKNKILISKGSTVNLPKYPDSIVQQVDLNNRNSDFSNVITSWANEGFTKNLEKNLTPETKSIFLNISTVKGRWKTPIDGSSPMMKVYNSFNYTQDVKYEARVIFGPIKLLELPLQADDLKLIIAVPNEQDTLTALVATLTDEGLEAAVNSIQPLFTASSVLAAPGIQFDSELTTLVNSKTAIQYGCIDVNKNGLSAKVLTCK